MPKTPKNPKTTNPALNAKSELNAEDAEGRREEMQGQDEEQAESAFPDGQETGLQANLDKNAVAGILDDIAILLELAGGNPFEVRAYQNAARAISGLEGDINEQLESGKLARTQGVGKTILSRVTELLETGRIQFYEQLLEEVPPGLRQMTRIPGLGAKRVRQLHDMLHISTVPELREAAQAGRVAGVPGFGAKMQEKILSGVTFLEQHQDRFQFDVAEAQATLVAQALSEMSQIVRLDVAGSLRRKRETIGDVDIVGSVAMLEDRAPVMNRLLELPIVESVTGSGETKSSVILQSGIALDVRLVLDEEYPYLLHHFTGSKQHHIALRNLALKDGIKINEYGLWRGDERIPCKTEADIYGVLGMQYIEPELREDRGEIEAALKGTLPNLVTEADLRGVLHVHTNWSDGGNTIREMAEAAHKLGFTYLGICDHSQQAAYAGGLTPARVREQQAEIDRINAELGPTIRILKGTECDILRDGTLDYDEETLKTFDFVVASIHSNFNLPPEQQTQRLIRAIENPYTSIIAHPTGRILLSREGYNPDMEAVIDVAGKHGVAIEINADPHRFDMDWRLLRFATERGVRIPVNPDAHSPGGMLNMRYGIGIARKGWLTAFDVLNTLPTDELLAFFAEQRARKGAR